MKYDIIVSVIAKGHQIFRLEADSPEDAVIKFKLHGADEIISEELEVQELETDKIHITDVTIVEE